MYFPTSTYRGIDYLSITKEKLENGVDVGMCPCCSPILKVIFVKDEFTCGLIVPDPFTIKGLVRY